jgi:DNA polymerase I-like protein with 3'-5' exonuclease and polymerase domains
MKYLLVLTAPMTEPMERLMYQHLHDAGIPRDQTQIVYVLQGESPDGKYGNATKVQLQKHRLAFRAQMEASDAGAIIAMGPEPFRAVTGLAWRIDDARGYIILPEDCAPAQERVQVEVGTYKTGLRKGQPKMQWKTYAAPPPLPTCWQGTWEMDTYGPHAHRRAFIVPTISWRQYVKQRRRQMTAVTSALENAVAYAKGEPLDDLKQWRTTVKDVRWLTSNFPLAFDLEAPIGSNSIERISTSNGLETTSLPWGEQEKAWLANQLRHSHVNIAHNIQYDVPVLRANGIEVPEPWFDTMIAASLIEPDLAKGLGSVIPIYLLAHPHKQLSAERGFNDPEYSAKDAFMEYRLYQEQWRTLEEWGMLDLFTKKIMRSVPALVDLKVDGLAVNAARAEAWCAKLRSELNGLVAWWDQNFPGVSSSSNKDITTLLYKTWHLPIQRSKHDGWTADELALRTLMEIAPKYEEPLKKLLQIRGVSKQLQTYGRALLGNRRVYPSYLPRGKDTNDTNKGLPGTGRLASSGPNIQNQTDEAREIFECDQDDWVFVAADQSQAELRIMSAKSNDAALRAALESGDVHAATIRLLGLTGPHARTLAKNGVYGTSYGAGPKRLVEMLKGNGVNTTIGEMREFQRALSGAYPQWWTYLQQIAALGQAQGYLRNDFGRVRRFSAPEADVPAMKDFIPQSDVGDIGWSTYRDAADGARALGGRLSMLVHDEIVVQVPRSRVKDACDMLRDVMGREFPEIAPGFRMPINCKVGTQWGPSMVKEEVWLTTQA